MPPERFFKARYTTNLVRIAYRLLGLASLGICNTVATTLAQIKKLRVWGDGLGKKSFGSRFRPLQGPAKTIHDCLLLSLAILGAVWSLELHSHISEKGGCCLPPGDLPLRFNAP